MSAKRSSWKPCNLKTSLTLQILLIISHSFLIEEVKKTFKKLTNIGCKRKYNAPDVNSIYNIATWESFTNVFVAYNLVEAWFYDLGNCDLQIFMDFALHLKSPWTCVDEMKWRGSHNKVIFLTYKLELAALIKGAAPRFFDEC
jgi:hypothetical protein